jgi:hypothetical protein
VETINAQRVNGNQSEETPEAAGTEHTLCIWLERARDHVHRGPSAAERNGPSAGSVGMSVIIGDTADRDAPRNTSL